MTPIWDYLSSGILPTDKNEARKLQMKAPKYVIQDGVMYKRAYLQPLLRCVGPQQGEYILREMHEGSCGAHMGSRMLAKKVLRWGYYWPTLFQDAYYFVQKCSKCQAHASIVRRPQAELIPIQGAWPFSQWGIDILGPFPEAPGRVKFLLVATISQSGSKQSL